MTGVLLAIGERVHSLFSPSFGKGLASAIGAVLLQQNVLTVDDLGSIFKACTQGVLLIYALYVLYREVNKKDQGNNTDGEGGSNP